MLITLFNPGEGAALILTVAPLAYIAPTAQSQQLKQPGAPLPQALLNSMWNR